jgi:hypothetical protein
MREGSEPVGALPSLPIMRQSVPDGQSIASIWSTVLGTPISLQEVPPLVVTSSTPSSEPALST